MPSHLTGLIKTLAWSDFKGNPDPNKPNLQAFTKANFVLPPLTPVPIPGTKSFHFQDNIAVTITMDSHKSWKRQPPDDLLKHEQGHYDIVALIARDLFIDIMQLKAKTYAHGNAALTDLRSVFSKYDGKPQAISTIYDAKAQTDHGINSAQQMRWNGLLQRAFTEPRSPQVTAPDGTAYKVPLLDVLNQNGINP
jgi:hypothetical protein